MLSRRAFRLIAPAEQQIFRGQYRHSRRGLRRLHQTGRRKAENVISPVDTIPAININAPTAVPSRQQHAPAISDELKFRQGDHPNPSVAESNPKDSQPPGANKVADIDALSLSDSPGRTGDNEEQRTSPKTTDTSLNRPPTPQEQAEELGAVQSGSTEETVQRLSDTREPAEEAVTNSGTLADADRLEDTPSSSLPGDEKDLNKSLIYNSKRHSTIAGSSSADVVLDHIDVIVDSSLRAESRDPSLIYDNMRKGKWVQLESGEEKNAVDASASLKEETPKTGGFKSVPQHAQKTLVDRLVRGVYNQGPQQDKKQPILKHIAQQTQLNGSYYPSDAQRFFAKVASLMSASAGEPKQASKVR